MPSKCGNHPPRLEDETDAIDCLSHRLERRYVEVWRANDDIGDIAASDNRRGQ
jgi:hypothetical protein